MKHFAIYILLILTSCVTQKRCAEKFPPVSSRDSIYIETLDTVKINIPGDSVKIETKVPCDDFELRTENGRLLQEIKVINGKLHQNLTIKPDTIYRTTVNTVTKVKEVKVSKPERYTPKIIEIFALIGISSVFSLLIYVYLKFKP